MGGRPARVGLDGPVHVDEQLLLQETDARAAREGHRTAVGRIETDDDPQERRLPGAVGTDEAGPITVSGWFQSAWLMKSKADALNSKVRSALSGKRLDTLRSKLWTPGFDRLGNVGDASPTVKSGG